MVFDRGELTKGKEMCRLRLLGLLAVLALLLTGCASHKAVPTAPPPLGTARTLEPGVTEYEVTLTREDGPERVWVYLPAHPVSAKIPCVFIAPAGSPLFYGMGLAESDRPEHLPYVRAGYAVVAYSLDGPVTDSKNERQLEDAAQAFKQADGGIANAQAAIDYALAAVPQIDAKRLYTAGHSSAGTVSLLVAENDPRIAASIAYAPCCDVPRRLGPDTMKTLDDVLPGERKFLTRRSPNAAPERLTMPLFLFHADDDSNVPTAEVNDFAGIAQRTNSHVTYVKVPTGNHYQSMIDQGIPRGIAWLQALPAS